MLLTPKNWATFQHYKDRCPPWIKLHRDLLNNRDFMRLPIASKALAPMLWLLASESKDGSFDGSLDELVFRLHITPKEYEDGLKPLIDKGFFLSADGMLAPRLRPAIPETETERETETKKRQKATVVATPSALVVRFDKFWAAYPKKVGKFDAKRSFEKRKPDDELLEKMLVVIAKQSASDAWRKDGGQFIPNPSTWLNQGRWEDEGVQLGPVSPVNNGPDPALVKIAEDRKRAAPIPDSVKEQMARILNKKVL